uniref:Uncharacterized protein n=1 Tax=Leersia perrieri TaxID=77586 RepID=A0A0D9XG13_9ORYZ
MDEWICSSRCPKPSATLDLSHHHHLPVGVGLLCPSFPSKPHHQTIVTSSPLELVFITSQLLVKAGIIIIIVTSSLSELSSPPSPAPRRSRSSPPSPAPCRSRSSSLSPAPCRSRSTSSPTPAKAGPLHQHHLLACAAHRHRHLQAWIFFKCLVNLVFNFKYNVIA